MNIIDILHDQPIVKKEILVNNISWNNAVSSGFFSDFEFNLNGTAKSHIFADNLLSIYCYWIYAYQPFTFKRLV